MLSDARQTSDEFRQATTPTSGGTAPDMAAEDARVFDKPPAKPWTVPYKLAGYTGMAMMLAVTAHQTPDTLRALDASVAGEDLNVKTPMVALAPHLEPLRAEMEEYRNLGEGWDGYGSIPPNPGVIENALAFLRAIPFNAPPPDPTVSADGSVGWFWKSPGKFISVNFPREGRFAYYGKAPGRDDARGAYAFDGETLPQDLLDVIMAV